VKFIKIENKVYGLLPVEMLFRATDIISRNEEVAAKDEMGQSDWSDWEELDTAYSEFVHDLVDHFFSDGTDTIAKIESIAGSWDPGVDIDVSDI
jgi:hypothetical protein